MNPLRHVAIRLGAQSWLPRYARYIIAADESLQKLSGGRLALLALAGLPELVLTVRGRKTGEPRTTPLLCVPHAGGWLVAGSNWGHPRTPAWVYNLREADEATVTFGGRSTTVSVRVAEGAEREQLWREMVTVWPNYDRYAERTDRQIPLFVLTPRS
ncbi:nitroreductase family deazaflavin-dependent oxidoreductase [Rhodococcus chondri]|uniref:Nitroreductase family deazaflavin-dependent oxidoreductase n=1 Tax=Rhodococcus chondri TaxID=3065941 RepID=A0ABU7JPG1_9NOCA|nr:nitroreductase family deazaflavin-dependent oxidoreductase [Rhodococcus sp. CC-R104]MEE2031779.1 nitroreductase family deazaflavin-dependent oxidoreductase [Rhodococcus sp. CC-R104]